MEKKQNYNYNAKKVMFNMHTPIHTKTPYIPLYAYAVRYSKILWYSLNEQKMLKTNNQQQQQQ